MNNGDPKHIAVIPDGNGRWAEKNGLSRVEGHHEGAANIIRFVENISHYDTEYVTIYAFSTENWKRPQDEVDALMDLLCQFIDENLDKLIREKIRLLAFGRIHQLSEKCREKLALAEKKTSVDYKKTFILALNYGGRAEIADASKKIAEKVLNGDLKLDEITEEKFSDYLYHPEVPDPDLLIRTSGEQRLSNFLLWELSYSELYFADAYWPDFDKSELEKALEFYRNRKRRFGGRP